MTDNLGSLLLPPSSLEELDIPQGLAIDLILRLLFTEGDTSAARIEEVVLLPFKVLDEILVHLQQEHLVEVPRTTGRLGRRSYLYSITDEGKARARDALERSQYIGPTPVPMEKYNKAIVWQSRREKVSPARVKEALSHYDVVVSETSACRLQMKHIVNSDRNYLKLALPQYPFKLLHSV